MDEMIYVSQTGATETMAALTAVSNNLANVSTTGFRADLAQFRSQPVFGPGHPSRVYAMTEGPGVDLNPGMIKTTGRDLDIAVQGEGWIAVQAPDGSEAYTRAGDLRLTANGVLETGAGHPVLGNGGPIAIPPAAALEIGADGSVSIQPLGQPAKSLAVVDRIRLVNPEPGRLEKGEDGLIHTSDGEPAQPDAAVKVASGALETSNVNAVGALVDLIGLQRSFELQIKAMQTAQQNETATSDMLKIG